MLIDPSWSDATPLRRALRESLHKDEADRVARLLPLAAIGPEDSKTIAATARRLVEAVRAETASHGGLDAFLQEFQLSSKEGVVLMCLAEALLRVPDSFTVDRLIRDKIGEADWRAHLGKSESLFVNASTWALMLTGRVLHLSDEETKDPGGWIRHLVHRTGEPVIRTAVHQAIRIMSRQFVMGRTIGEALERARPMEAKGYRYSYDMLGEGARTMADADRYLQSYLDAVAAIGKANAGRGPIEGPGLSVKLSALHPRYELAQRERVMRELLPRIAQVCAAAKAQNMGLTIDAEEAARLDLSLDVIEALALDPQLAGWDGLGLAMQAYQTRAVELVDWLADLARRAKRRLFVRLVKGAYWDSEIKWAQEQGLATYPVYSRKATTDVSYIACMKKLLAEQDAFYPAFATHNAHSLATALSLAGNRVDYEFQRLHGMGEELYDEVVGPEKLNRPCRVYAPVGSHEDLLAYLVRRLLENGANSSFVNRIADEALPVEAMIVDPVVKTQRLEQAMSPNIPLPRDLYGKARVNSSGLELSDPATLQTLAETMNAAVTSPAKAGPMVAGRTPSRQGQPVHCPADSGLVVGEVVEAEEADIEAALAAATKAAPGWDARPAAERASRLEAWAEAMEAEKPALMALCQREAGKTLADANAEVREAVDFLRYYAMRARLEFAEPEQLPGPTGEYNAIRLAGRGTFLCISPWNFPLAIFTGQVAGALAAGNAAIAKPAEQTPLIAAAAVRLAHKAGIPADVLQLLPGDGLKVGAPLVADPRISGVAFTGSVPTAKAINRSLAERPGPIVPLIAETGGQNAMIVDSTALPEQVVRDVLVSAFQSAGQRCSALRLLCVQEDVAERTLRMLAGAMKELKVGNPEALSTDVGPVIDAEAKAGLEAHIQALRSAGMKVVGETPLGPESGKGHFVAPIAFELDSLSRLTEEHFGPVLHILRYKASKLKDLVRAINDLGFGLTFGIHSRIDATINEVVEAVQAGNAYVNRNMIGAIVGVQPFGGEGLSGTGPKAGGPRYLHRFAVERTVSRDMTASGGNASLMSMQED